MAGNMKTSGTPAASSKMVPNVMSSTQLLEAMRRRNHLTNSEDPTTGEDDTEEARNQTETLETNPQSLDLITDIRNHIAFACAIDGQASTDELLEHFNTRLPVNDSARFKAMLKQICTFSKNDDVGIWRLKPEFR